MDNKKVWLVTGASQGIGLLTVKYLLARKQVVIAATRNKESFDTVLQQQAGLDIVGLDVTDDAAVKQVTDDIILRHGRIDVLVNNAGYGFIGAVEEATEAEIQQVLAVNVMGVFNTLRHVLPYMRRARNGHVINLSSASGLVSAPAFGIYNASKYAVEGLTEALKLEVQGMNIKVTLIEPGAFRTNFLGTSLNAAGNEIADYGPTAGQAKKTFLNNNGKQPGNPEKAAEAIVGVTELEQPPLRLLLGADAYQRVKTKYATMLAEMENMKEITFSTGF